ncbi:hypothetical protein A1Q2_07329 [Trichosporon asahii var. asahii CBS 8904]|uniref:PCI domain-containing protein n=1 Tax=Trichosporon asahii var. asahii (strain CBS 8904) TaxID=1220162 RepID=K1VBX5_TRIAC|nr:hypothetical protein A1Q2_07329 [Trichosporon asahii var. asahii CBS 8904]
MTTALRSSDSSLEADLERAELLQNKDAAKAEEGYRAVLDRKADNEAELKCQETALLKLGALYRDKGKTEELAKLVKESRAFMSQIAKAKTAKLIRSLIDLFPSSARDLQMKVTKENIDWARSEKRVFLRQSLEIKLIALHIDAQNYREALSMSEELLRELKQLDDKIILTEVFLLESRAAHAIQNLPRAKAQLDLQAGALNADDKDYKTAYSYFFEAFEGFTQVDENDPRALSSLKYMLLCKIMMGSVSATAVASLTAQQPDDVNALLSMKSASRFSGKDLEAMKATAEAQKERSLELFKSTLKEYQDPLYDTLLEQNLLRVIEPYSAVELSWISHEVGQGRDVVEENQMILDQVFFGVLNEKEGTLEVFDGLPEEMGGVIQALYDKVSAISSSSSADCQATSLS